ncbi:MAG: N-acetyl-gamma-glutamyl-phosphate reductase [Christensenellales bacterium]
MKSVFIDGSAGTTGLRILDRLSHRDDIRLITLSENDRKDYAARKNALNQSDVAILCLPDAAAQEAVEMIENPDTVVIDTSTAHRTADGWTYGFAELTGIDAIANSKRIANPGCHASGFIALVKPLVDAGILDKSIALTCWSVTGYSGGGKKMIEQYESGDNSILISSPAQYALSQSHKHLKEMKSVTRIEFSPAFYPIVAPFFSGMEVSVPLFAKDIKASMDDIKKVYKDVYAQGLVSFCDDMSDGGFIYANKLSGADNMLVSVAGNEERISLIALYDNLGKGASGSAIENLNIVLGQDITKGLIIKR